MNHPPFDVLFSIFNSLKNPIVFTDCDHIIRYMNQAAIKHYKEGDGLLNTSLLDCHNQESVKMIYEVFHKLKSGVEEQLITDNKDHKIYMRAVRNAKGELIGYYERYHWK